MENESEFLQSLYKKTIKELRVMGRDVGVFAPATLSKSDLIAQIRAIVYGTEMPVSKNVSKKPVKEDYIQQFEQKRQVFLSNLMDELPVGGQEINKIKLWAASPVSTFENNVDEEIKNIDLSNINEDDIAVVYIDKKQSFILEIKTKTKYPISLELIEKYQLHDGDFIFGDVIGENKGFYDVNIKWINGYWLKKEDVEQDYIMSESFDLGKDNFGYSRLLSVFAPIVRGKANLVGCFTRESENQIICEVCADIKKEYASVSERSIGFNMLDHEQKQMQYVTGYPVFNIKNDINEECFEKMEQFFKKVFAYFNADGEVVVVIRNLQLLFEKLCKCWKNEDKAIEYIQKLLSNCSLRENKNAVTIIATMVFDCDASYLLYAKLVECFASDFEMIVSDNEEFEICDIEKSKNGCKIIDKKLSSFVDKQKNLAKKQGLLKTNKELFERINVTKSNIELF